MLVQIGQFLCTVTGGLDERRHECARSLVNPTNKKLGLVRFLILNGPSRFGRIFLL